jgi:hypothetical protein
MGTSLKNALFKMMQNKEQDTNAKAQFKADIENLNDTMKFAIQAVEEKLNSQMEIMERKLKYQIEGFQKTVEQKLQKHADITKGEGNSIAAFTATC